MAKVQKIFQRRQVNKMVDAGEIILNILVYMNIYWYLVPFSFVGALYWVFVKVITFPLASNKGQEFVILTRPENVIIQKVVNRFYPFFQFKKGLYWFSTPCSDIGSNNKYHVYIEGLNQDVSEIGQRRDGKLGDLMHTKMHLKQTKKHQILLPKLLKKHLHRHYSLTIDPVNKMAQLQPEVEKQPFKISLWHTLGVYIQEEKEVQTEQEIEGSASNNQKYVLNAITTESVITQMKYIQGYSYFSSDSAHAVYKGIKSIESNFITWVKGTMDPKIMAIMILMMAAVAIPVIFMVFLKPDLGPMPTG